MADIEFTMSERDQILAELWALKAENAQSIADTACNLARAVWIGVRVRLAIARVYLLNFLERVDP